MFVPTKALLIAVLAFTNGGFANGKFSQSSLFFPRGITWPLCLPFPILARVLDIVVYSTRRSNASTSDAEDNNESHMYFVEHEHADLI